MLTQRGVPPRKALLRTVVGLVILSQGLALIGDLLLASFVDRHPALLIALNPRNRNLALATTQLTAGTYYAVGFTRLVLSDPLYYLLGYWYGDRAIAWTERRSRTYGPLIRDGERLFRRAAYPLIFLAPNNIICALSAATGVRLGVFIGLNLTGTVARLILVRQLGQVFSSPLQGVVHFIAHYRIWFLILSAIAVAWTVFGEFRRDDSELETLLELAEDGDDTAGNPADGTAGTGSTDERATGPGGGTEPGRSSEPGRSTEP